MHTALQRLFFALNFYVVLIFFPFLVYLLVVRPNRLGKFKYYLLNSIWSSFCFNTAVYLVQPCYLLPSFCISVNVPRLLKSVESAPMLMFSLYMFGLISADMSVVFSFFYRYAQAFPHTLQHLFEYNPWIYFGYFLMFSMTYGIYVIPMWLTVKLSKVEVNQLLLDNGRLDMIDRSEGIMCFTDTTQKRSFLISMSLYLVFMFMLGTGLFAFLWLRQNRILEKASTTTRRFQKMLLHTLAAQLFVGLVFLLFPEVFHTTFPVLKTNGAEVVSNFISCWMGFHGVCDYATIIYFIHPFRRFVINALMRRRLTSDGWADRTVTASMRSASMINGIPAGLPKTAIH